MSTEEGKFVTRRDPVEGSLGIDYVRLVAVDVGLEGTLDGQAEVLSLDVAEGGELSLAVSKVETGDLLVEDLGEDVDTDVELVGLGELDVLLSKGLVSSLVKHDLSKDLVGERAGHDKRRVAGSTAKVDKTALSKEDDVAAAGHEEAVNLGLDVLDRGGVLLEPSNVNLDIEVTNVANNGIVGHSLEVLASEDVTAASGGDEDLTELGSLLHGGDLVTSHGSLEGVDGVNLGDNDASTHAVEGHSATLTDITETGDDSDLASNHDIGSTLDTVDEGLTAAVKVVELGLSDGVVDVDGGDKELVVTEHAVEVVDTGGGLLRDTEAVLEHLRVLLVDKGGQVTTVVEDEVELLVVLEGSKLLLEAPVVLLVGLTLPGEDGDTGGGNGSGGVVLSGEDVAAGPGNLSTESSEGLDEDGGLDGHVKATSDAGTGERLVGSILGSGLHETGHLVLSELDLLAAKGGKRKVSDLEFVGGSRHDG
ncbi:hypothetical protein HG531_002936 [Fusarium graminearum]|nr:hypothetical protein HG531_002936 [Fusarium graminearum]